MRPCIVDVDLGRSAVAALLALTGWTFARRPSRGSPTEPATRSRSMSSSCSRSTFPIRWTRRSWRCSARATSPASPRANSCRRCAAAMHGKVAITYFEWAGAYDQRIVVPWRLIDGPETADAFANEIARAPYPPRLAHLDLGRAQFRQDPCSTTAAIAASGASSTCPATAPTTAARFVTHRARRGARRRHHHQRPADHAEAAELFTMDIDNLDVYFEDCVIGGPARSSSRSASASSSTKRSAPSWCWRSPAARPNGASFPCRRARRACPARSASRCGRSAGGIRLTAALCRRRDGRTYVCPSIPASRTARDQLPRCARIGTDPPASRARGGSRRRPGCGHRARRSPGLHDTATTVGTVLLAISRACASRALAWRIEDHGVESRLAPSRAGDGGTGRAAAP